MTGLGSRARPIATLFGAAFACLAAIASLALAGCSAGHIDAPRYVLSYGLGDYPPLNDSNPNDDDLSSPTIDAQAMRDLLISSGYADAYSGARFNDSVTKAQIESDIVGLASLEDDAIIVIFYSSHGTYDPYRDIAYLVPYDYEVDLYGYAVVSSLISPDELSSWIAQSGQRNVIVILHTCFSGGFVDPGASIDIAPQNYGPGDFGTTPPAVWTALGKFGELLTKNAEASGAPGPIVISAAGSRESAWESDFISSEHAVFPYFLFESAARGDANGDGFVTATEAYAYAASMIESKWNRYYQFYYDSEADMYADFMPHISGGSRDLVLFGK